MAKLMFSQLSVLITLLFAAQGCAMGARPGPVTITGTIRLVGNEPFARLVLTPDENLGTAPGEREYLLVGPLTEELKRSYQLKRMRLEGLICVSPLPEFARCFKPSRILENPDQRQ
jgi:hypothetical protein